MTEETRLIADGWAHQLAADIAQAEHTVTLSALSLQPPRRVTDSGISALWESLVMASARRRRVRLILPASAKTHPATAGNNAAAGWANKYGMHTYLIALPRLLHAKTAMIDERISWVGSGNLTAAAANHNHEAWIRATGPETALALMIFHDNLTNHRA
jgi:phosphatidylserine/phosphatidylglycerophosphate/cardiolipin synthase-like enzyme